MNSRADIIDNVDSKNVSTNILNVDYSDLMEGPAIAQFDQCGAVEQDSNSILPYAIQ